MSRNFQSFQQVFSFAPKGPGESQVNAQISNAWTCGRERATEGILATYGSAISALQFPRFTGDVRVSKVIINEIDDVEFLDGIGGDITVVFITKDLSGNFAKTEFKLLAADNGAKVFTLADGDMSLVPENLAELEMFVWFGTDATVDGAGTCIPRVGPAGGPTFGKFRVMVTLELPRA